LPDLLVHLNIHVIAGLHTVKGKMILVIFLQDEVSCRYKIMCGSTATMWRSETILCYNFLAMPCIQNIVKICNF